LIAPRPEDTEDVATAMPRPLRKPVIPTRRRLAREIVDLQQRVEGLEFVVSAVFFDHSGSSAAADPETAAKVARELERSRGGAAWRRS
jgi:adenosylmethionine-8-amino-7-oxononanoate aminotransferase